MILPIIPPVTNTTNGSIEILPQGGGTMPLSKAKKVEYMREHRKRGVIPKPENVHSNTVIPKQHCRLPFCVICDPERYQEWFKKT